MFGAINLFIAVGLIIWSLAMTAYNLFLFYFYGVILTNFGFFYLGVATITGFSLFSRKVANVK